MGAVSSVRKLTVDSIALLELLEPKSVELAAKRSVRLRVQQLLSISGLRVVLFRLARPKGFGGCDIDLGIYFEDVNVYTRGQFSPQKCVDLLLQRASGSRDLFKCSNFFAMHAYLYLSCGMQSDRRERFANTALLKFYGQVDPRVRPLVFAVKYWAKQRGINDSSHYAKMQLPAVHSSFHDLQSHMKVSELLHRLQSFPRTELASTFGRTKPNSVGALLEGFFDYYAHRFNLEDEVVSVRIGSALSNTTKWSRPVS
ncbi:hypothetical protein PsorP6_003232 [Peronosclerospora sorghi]|uniref:Uncharacterized protein n=1 Tax=Peronosclerospora sorghi TaxID=230839 RepID=A0ACC0VLH0_9STRA|nr:hypothetical protein PsorP6_003232 [Peronosclerospora sorghi]